MDETLAVMAVGAKKLLSKEQRAVSPALRTLRDGDKIRVILSYYMTESMIVDYVQERLIDTIVLCVSIRVQFNIVLSKALLLFILFYSIITKRAIQCTLTRKSIQFNSSLA